MKTIQKSNVNWSKDLLEKARLHLWYIYIYFVNIKNILWQYVYSVWKKIETDKMLFI